MDRRNAANRSEIFRQAGDLVQAEAAFSDAEMERDEAANSVKQAEQLLSDAEDAFDRLPADDRGRPEAGEPRDTQRMRAEQSRKKLAAAKEKSQAIARQVTASTSALSALFLPSKDDFIKAMAVATDISEPCLCELAAKVSAD